jgi:chaperonin GroES
MRAETRAETRTERENGTMKIRPLQDRILLRQIEGEAKTAGGIIIPDSAKEKPQEGVIVATGKGKVRDDGKLTPLDVKVGDKVLYGKYSGNEITVSGDKFVIVREEDILAVLG